MMSPDTLLILLIGQFMLELMAATRGITEAKNMAVLGERIRFGIACSEEHSGRRTHIYIILFLLSMLPGLPKVRPGPEFTGVQRAKSDLGSKFRHNF